MIVLFAVGGGGDPERHRPLLDHFTTRGHQVIAPSFDRLHPQQATWGPWASPRPCTTSAPTPRWP